MDAPEDKPDSRTARTDWSLIGRAAASDHDIRLPAQQTVIERHSPALRAFLRYRLGVSEQDADDVLQGFIAERILEKRFFDKATRGRGKFRAFLYRSLRNYAVDRWRSKAARPQDHLESLAGDDRVLEFSDHDAEQPDRRVDAAWAREFIREALQRMEREYVGKGRPDVWGVFRERIVRPLLDNQPKPSYSVLVKEFDFATPTAAQAALVTAKRGFQRILRDVAAEYAPDNPDEEIDDLIRVLSN